MVAIKNMEMPSSCYECEYRPKDCSYCLRLHQAIPRDKYNTSRLSNCPLVEIEERKVEKCTDCNEYNQAKHYCSKFCDVIRDTTKEMQEYYKGEHEKLELIKQIVNKPRIFADEYFKVAREIKEVLEQE